MNNAVTRMETAAPVARSIDHMELIAKAVDKGDLELVARMLDLRERFDKIEARKDFDQAIAAAKAEIPVIIKNRQGHNNKRYADFAAIASAIDPILGKHGLSYRFRTAQTDKIAVTCILSHKSGHCEETTLAAQADTSGNKNSIQAIGSSLTYLQRYTLVQMLGLAASEDDDGKSVKDEATISDEQVIAIRDRLLATNTPEARFAKFFKVEKLSDIPAARYADVNSELSYLEQKRGEK